MSGPLRVLYVDDSIFDRELVRDALLSEPGGFALALASSREAFEAELSSGDFDLVLSDFNILGYEGLDVIARVRELRPGLPVVIVTGTGSEEIAVEALKGGASDYVIKSPSHIRKLPETLRSAVRRRRFEEDKEALLREVHHRVKNNFQVIISLLGMQADCAPEESTRLFLREVESQARAMSFAYEQASRSADLSSVPMRDYLGSIVSACRGGALSAVPVELRLSAEELSMDISQALPCGLLVNELLANALKFAFPPRFKGSPSVFVELGAEGEGYRLLVEDNGVGFPSGFDWERAEGLGLRLVRLLAIDQLGGSVSLARPLRESGGSSFDIRFPVSAS